MNVEDLSRIDSYTFCGHTLNLEERTALQNSLTGLKRQNKLKRLIFWGKIFGLQRDYLIAQGWSDNSLSNKRSFASQDGVEWFQLPDIKEEIVVACAEILGGFSGDASQEYVIEIEKIDPMNEESIKQVITISEESRLAHIIHVIDSDCSVVPRGAFISTAQHEVVANSSFQGLSVGEMDKLSNFMHLREPQKLVRKTLLQREGLSKTFDFLDTLDEDTPSCWTLHKERVLNQVTLKSLKWLGYSAFHTANSTCFGGCYFGTGEKNRDLGFML